jgi:nucleoside-diphosphate kinase
MAGTTPLANTHAIGDTVTASTVDWSLWTVILLKPDCVARGLVDAVLADVAAEITVVDQRLVVATETQIRLHYEDLLTIRRAHFTWVEVAVDLRRTYAGHQVGIALGYAPDAATRLRNRLGHYDPSLATPDTVRGRFGIDCLQQAQSQHRLIANLIHSSDHPAGAEREFDIWYGPALRYLVRAPDTHPARRTP